MLDRILKKEGVTMKKLMNQPAMAIVVAAALLLGGAQAQAQAPEISNPPIKVKAHKKSAKTKAAGQGKQAKFVPGSQETVTQRRDRLQRECQGAVNAGACSGYTR